MRSRRISGFVLPVLPVLFVVGLSAAALGAERATLGAPLADAAEHRDKARVRALLGTGVDVNAAQIDGTTALHWAAYYDDAETAALLVRAGANVNAVNRYGVPPLSLACSTGSGAIRKSRGGERAPDARRQTRRA